MNKRVTGSESNSVELNTAAEAEALTLSPALRSAEGIMLALSRSSGLLRAALRHNFTPRANISAKPAKHVVSTGVSTEPQHTPQKEQQVSDSTVSLILMCL